MNLNYYLEIQIFHFHFDMLTVRLIFLAFLYTLITSESVDNPYKNVRCKSFDPQVIKFDICKVNANQVKKSLNIAFTLFKPLNKPLYLQIITSKKTRENFYQEYIRTGLIDYCSTMEGAMTNVFVAGIIEGMRDSAPELIHPCPFNVGFVNVSNLVIDFTKTLNFLMAGNYKTEVSFYKKNKAPFAMVRLDQENQSRGKNKGSVDKAPDSWKKVNKKL